MMDVGPSRPENGPERRPTMRDVAAEAAVSLKTVSRVINREDGVRPELVERVEAAVRGLGYRRDDRASNLRSSDRSTSSIGFVQVDVANPFFSSIFRGIEDVARRNGSIVLSGSCDGDPDREAELIETLVARRVDGLIVVPTPAVVDLLQSEIDHGMTIVCVDLTYEDLPTDVVMTDHHHGGRRATEHLIAHGHRRIAFLGDHTKFFSARERLRGYEQALETSGLVVDPDMIRTGLGSPTSASAALEDLLASPEPPTAIFTAQNFVTIGAVRTLHGRGLQTKIAQVGLDDVELADVVEPGISVVPQNPLELGRLAAERLFGRVSGEIQGQAVTVELSSDVVARGSGEIRPI